MNRITHIWSSGLMAAFLLSLAAPLVAQPVESAKEIVRKADLHVRGNTSQATIIFRIVRPTWSRDMTTKTWSKGNKLAMIRIEAPVKDRGTVYLKREKEVWNWIPSIERNIKLPPSMMSQSWMGTDFTNDDLVKEFSILEDYDHTLVGEEKIGDRICHIVELIPKPSAAVVWGKVRIWIDKKDYLQLKGEYFDESGKLVNRMVTNDIRMLGGRLLPAYMEMLPINKPGQKTVLIYKEIQFDKPIPDHFFTVENMKKIQ
ncbi:outer membrane lipoprotein-sorting protein [Flavihumibacter stibioxidans]|nr:outer membrane lipoprotein-sorting protein [Flavihumibacter stibioxidans]